MPSFRNIRLPGRWLSGWIRSTPPDTPDSLEAFGSEHSAGARPADRVHSNLALVLALVTTVLGASLGGYFLQKWWPFPVEAATAPVTIESNPPGAEVLASGVRQGTTPLTLALAPGEHVFEIIHAGRRKSLRTQARAGAAVVHHVEFGPRSTAARPVAPPAAAGGHAAGWLQVKSPVPLEIREGNAVIGTSESSRTMMRAGRRELQLTNEALGVSERRVVRLLAGSTTSITIVVPQARLSINALPWAEVWVDGSRVGETPIGNYLVSVGGHEIVFRHPELGERRRTVIVSLKATAPARVSVDMRKPQ